jgi:hypothetical protein
MPEYRIEFPDGDTWKINVTGKKGDDALRTAHTRAAAARAAGGKIEPVSFEDCTVRKVTAQLRAELKGLTYLDAEALLEACKEIGTEYESKGLALTLRGMYYQLVSRGKLPSGQKEYDRVKNSLASARLRGTFPLDLLSDSSRTMHAGDATRYDLDIDNAIEQAKDWIPRLDQFFIEAARWYRQPDLPIVLFEKEAITNVFGPTCRELGISWMATKGYPSVSTLFELHQLLVRSMDPIIRSAEIDYLGYNHLQDLDPEKEKDLNELLSGHADAVNAQVNLSESDGYWTDENEEEGLQEHDEGERFRYRYGGLTATEWHQGTGRTIRLLYFGDHDPDGMEIPNDLERRLRIIQVRTGQIVPFTIERLGLNRAQIEKYNPPPFWAKESSSRHKKYITEHAWVNDRAWELDALDPTLLRDIVKTTVNGYFRKDIHATVQAAVKVARDEFNVRLRNDVLPNL